MGHSKRQFGTGMCFLRLLMLLVMMQTNALSQTFNFKSTEASEILSASQIHTHTLPDTLRVWCSDWDDIIAHPGTWGGLFKLKSDASMVKFYVNHYYPVTQQPYTYQLLYHIYGYYKDPNVDSTAFVVTSDTLTITNFNHNDPHNSFQDIQLARFTGYYKIMVVLDAILDYNNGSPIPATLSNSMRWNFNVEASMLTQRYDKTDYGAGASLQMRSVNHNADNYVNVFFSFSGDTLPVPLTPINYELEWTYVDDYNIDPSSGSVSHISPSALNYDFSHNNTRVWLDSNHYRIPIVYPSGYIVYRVRSVRPDTTAYKYPIYSDWSYSTPDSGPVSSVSSYGYFHIDTAYTNDSLNWQYTISFAEGGKYKHVVGFYDGLLKNRESITRFNSNPNMLIVTKNIFDFEGRPSIKTLPAPVGDNSFSFQHNVDLNAVTGLPYRANDFDTGFRICPATPYLAPLAPNALASIYYSNQNPDTTGVQRFVPDAGGYPMVQTVFAPVFNDRVINQCGAGPSLQIQSGNIITNYYVSTFQTNLDRLLGLDAGWNSYYNMTVSRDPNTQLSMSIKNFEGKLVASSMIGTGPNPENHAITSLGVPGATYMHDDLLVGMPQEITSNSRIGDVDFYNEAEGNDTMQYFLQYPPYVICPSLWYLTIKGHVDYRITDACGDTLFAQDTAVGVNNVIPSGSSVTFSAPPGIMHLLQGEYHVHKELHFSEADVDAAIDSFLAELNAPPNPNTKVLNCLHTEPWLIRQRVESLQFPCPGPLDPCQQMEQNMLHDMYPGGTYAAYSGDDSSHSIFRWIPGHDTVSFGEGYVVKGGHYLYQDSCLLMHIPDTITIAGITYIGLREMPEDSFLFVYNLAIAHGDNTIAEALLPLHPEYCMLKACFNDTFKTMLLSLPNAQVAEQLHLLYLDSIIAHDPFASMMSGMAADSLSTFPGDRIRLDSLELMRDYCGCGDSVMFKTCVTSIFDWEIRSHTLINDYVKNLYFSDMINMYLQNRQRFVDNFVYAASGDSCRQCDSIRLPLSGDGSFPPLSTSSGLPSAWTDSAFAGMGIGSWLLTTMSGGSLDSATLAAYADSALGIYSGDTSGLCHGTADSVTAHLANCAGGDSTIYNRIHAILDSLCSAHLAPEGNFTPEQIRYAITASGAPLTDLCNPYLIDLGLFSDSSTAGTAGCFPDTFYAQMDQFLGKDSVIIALEYPNTYHHYTLDPLHNIFEQNIYNVLGTVTPVITHATYDTANGLYTLYVFDDPSTSLFDTAKIYLRSLGGSCGHFFGWGAVGHTMSITDVDCSNSIPQSYMTGLIDEFSFITHVTDVTSATSCALLGWTDSLLTMADRNNNLNACVPCTQIRQLYTAFMDTMASYGVVGPDHPFYDNMLLNFMNYKLGRAFSADQYNTFIESCALADSMKIPLYVGYSNLIFATTTDANNFIDTLNSIDSAYAFDDIYRDSSVLGITVAVDLNIPPASELYLYKSKIASYLGAFTSRVVNAALANLQPANAIGFIYAWPGTVLPSPATIFGTGETVTFSAPQTRGVWMGASYVLQDFYYVIGTTGTPPYEVSRDVYELPRYFYNNGIPANFVGNYQSTVNMDYYKPQKIDYLRYTYNYQQLPPYQVLDSVQAQYLPLRIAGYAYDQVSYTQPFNPNVVTNLYLSDSTMRNRFFDTLSNIVHWVQDSNIVNPGHIFFDTNKVVVLPNIDSPLIAFRCGDGTYWYRYFGAGDTMYNVYVAMPPWIPQHDHPHYHLISVGPPPGIMLGLGDSTTRYFTLNLVKDFTTDTVQARGMTTFVIGKNVELDNVLLGNPITSYSGATAYDTFENCERDRLNTGIREGCEDWQHYIDSIVNGLRVNMIPYVMSHLTEKLDLGYWNQEFDYTLYYYDRAGNLDKTIPPTGVNFLPANRWDSVDTWRTTGGPVDDSLLPAHTKPSTYNYNSINEIVQQNTPDAGQTRFFYDGAGRLIFSQNSKQQAGGYFTYNLYDKQNRIIETGQVQMGCPYFPEYLVIGGIPIWTPMPDCFYGYTEILGIGRGMGVWAEIISPYPPYVRSMLTAPVIPTPYDSLYNMIRHMDRSDVVMTIYDTAATNLYNIAGYYLDSQVNLRKRVAVVKYFKYLSALDSIFVNYTYASHFSYDIDGNVNHLVQDYPALGYLKQRYKRVDYDYDLISGKVNMLSYNRSFGDQYYQRYTYDDDNRINTVETSGDGVIWHNDVQYEYYEHGPLAREDVGDQHVQGIDYAYTLQGWLKIMNSDTLNATMDMGRDASTTINASDAAHYSIDYFTSDYKPITSWQSKHVLDETRSLYNGNIARQTIAMAAFRRLNKNYEYDQMNRIHTTSYATIDPISLATTPVSDYHNNYSYDQDGNIQSLVRYGNDLGSGALVMDSLMYSYGTGLGGYTPNELKNLKDYAPNSYPLDIHNYTSGTPNYMYDPTGNTTKDLVSGQDTVEWNLYNKVTETQNHAAGNTMDFDYDGAGNRVAKYFTQVTDTGNQLQNDYWVHDAQGNILARYRETLSYRNIPITWVVLAHTTTLGLGVTEHDYIYRYVSPAYRADLNFQQHIMAYATATPSFEDIQMSRPVSFFLANSPNLYNGMTAGDPSYVMPLIRLEQANTDTIIGPAIDTLAQYSPQAFGTLISLLFSDPAMEYHAMDMACPLGTISSTPLDQLAASVGIDTVLPCDTMAAYLAATVGSAKLASAFVGVLQQHPDELAAYAELMVTDTTIYTDLNFSNPQSQYINLLENTIASYANHSGVVTFFDSYPQAENMLDKIADEPTLMQICYNASNASFLYSFDSVLGGNYIDSAIAERPSVLPPAPYYSLVSSFTGTLISPAYWYSWETVLADHSMSLAEHDFYGSSRLGIKNYWPGQVGLDWNYTAHTADTLRLWQKLPWYSQEYQDVIKDSMRDIYGNALTRAYVTQHVTGQKQYEVTDHLGDVLATVSDARQPADTLTGDTIHSYTPIVQTAYDYYPFGMYMPARYMDDSNTHCNFFTEEEIVPVKDSVWQPWFVTWGGFTLLGGATINPYQPGIILKTSALSDGLALAPMSVSAGTPMEFDLSVLGATADYNITVSEGSSMLGSSAVATGYSGIVAVPFTSGTGTITVTVSPVSPGGGSIVAAGHWVVTTRYVSESVVTNVCSGEKYPYGHNGKYKDNEWAGVGNHYDYGARLSDPRIGRFISVDPLTRKYPWYTPYQFAGNQVINSIDMDGLEEYHAEDGSLIGNYGTSTEVRVVFKDYMQKANLITHFPQYLESPDAENDILRRFGSAAVFGDEEGAAHGWGMEMNGTSIVGGNEMSSYIFSANISGKQLYSYSQPLVGNWYSSPSYNAVSIHSHGSSSPGANDFSTKPGDDIDIFNQYGKKGFIATPDGSLKMYDPSTKKQGLISEDLPSDKNEGENRKNNIDPVPHKEYYNKTKPTGDSKKGLKKIDKWQRQDAKFNKQQQKQQSQ